MILEVCGKIVYAEVTIQLLAQELNSSGTDVKPCPWKALYIETQKSVTYNVKIGSSRGMKATIIC